MSAPVDIPVAILAGGLATRLRPITEKIPKSLVAVAGRPFLAHQLELLHARGIRRAVLCIGFLGEMIERDYGDGAAFGIELCYSFDGPTLLGTGGAIKRALPKLGAEFFILYGDSYLPIPYAPVAETFHRSGKLGLMTVYRNEGKYDTSNVVFREGEIAVYDKKAKLPEMRHIDYGLSLFKSSVFDAYAADQVFDLAEVMGRLVREKQLAGYEVQNDFTKWDRRRAWRNWKPFCSRDNLCFHSSFEIRNLKFEISMSFTNQFLAEVQQVTAQLDEAAIEKCADELAAIRERGGRLFILGVGGSAGNAGHAVNDFRKICGFEAYAPTDNVSELTARTNDEGWATVFVEWLKGSRLNAKDGLLIFSVGGGNLEKNVSPNLVTAIQLAKKVGASVIGIVGRDGGYTAKEATACVIVPTVNPAHVTPHSEAFQAVIWHLFVSHPKLKVAQTKWESTK